jgi:hypothetical protein
MTDCPACGKPVDSLRAPAVGVRDGKVIGFCSKECAASLETKPTAAPRQHARADSAPAAKAGRRTPAQGVPKKMVDTDSGPVIEILHEPASGVVSSSADPRVSGSSPSSSQHAEADGAIQIADTGHIDDYVDPDLRRGRGLRVVVVLLLVVAAGGVAAYYLGYLDRLLGRGSAAANTVPASPPPKLAEEPPVDAAPTITPSTALERARAALRAQLKSDSPRVQRLAAMAYARTRDHDAIEALTAMMAKEPSEIARLDIAYALARGGDKRGLDALLAALGSPRRDVKLEAANRLAQLGDARAAETLGGFLEYSQFRLGAAEQLAYLADPRALDVLDKLRADPKALPDDQARAVIALGRAGRTDVTPALHALLADAHFNASAAIVLASHHDGEARRVLNEQLSNSFLRAAAARALRRLDPGLDPTPLLPPLVGALASTKDTEQVGAAEAILLLTGQLAWSERD